MLNKTKKQILPMLDTLDEALTYISTVPEKSIVEIIGAEIREFIRAIVGAMDEESIEVISTAEKIVHLLSQFEIEYKAKEIQSAFLDFSDAIKQIPVQFKAVFLPYYENTWDALESVYYAFAEDPLFVVEVVIIPIRRNIPGGFIHVYEDYLTQKGIPNTHYEEYSFTNDCPDFVFYCNPYDGVNYPKFEFQSIRPHVGTMVYIPYFIYAHYYLPKEKFAQNMIQNTELPGHCFADIIITQGEAFIERFGPVSKNGNKFRALGTSKMDFFINRKQEIQTSLEEANNYARTVFLLNTHYSFVGKQQSLVSHAIDYMFELLKQTKDITLIWRPHPQSFFMLGNQTDENVVKFRKYLQYAEELENVILDTSSSVKPALLVSHAIISSPSSIASEAIFLNKPVFLLVQDNREIVDLEKYYSVEYRETLRKKNIKKTKYIYFQDAVEHFGIKKEIPEGEDYHQYIVEKPLGEFVYNICNRIDIKKDIREKYISEQFSVSNCSVGERILNLIKLFILEGESNSHGKQ